MGGTALHDKRRLILGDDDDDDDDDYFDELTEWISLKGTKYSIKEFQNAHKSFLVRRFDRLT